MTTQRTQQIGAEIHRATQDVLQRGAHDPRIRGLISVVEVDVAPDLSEAVIRVSVLPQEHGILTVKGLQAAQKYFRSEIAQRVSLRRMPRIQFVLDETLKKQAAVHAAINRATPSTDDAALLENEEQDAGL